MTFGNSSSLYHFILNLEILVPQSLISLQLYTFSVRNSQVLLHFEQSLECTVPILSAVEKNPVILTCTDLPEFCRLVDHLLIELLAPSAEQNPECRRCTTEY